MTTGHRTSTTSRAPGQAFLSAVLAATLSAAGLALAATDYTAPGPLPVGFTVVHLTTTSVTTGAPRVLDTLVWYPAMAGTGTPDGAFVRDADVAKGRFPLVVFSHGSCGIPAQSGFLMQALASRGFIVAAPPHPGNTTSVECFAGSDLQDSYANRPADVRFVADSFLAFGRDAGSRFHRHVRPKGLGVTGHSFGGQTAIRVGALDHRFRAVLALAPALVSESIPPVRAPLMVEVGTVDSLTPLESEAVPNYQLGARVSFLVEIENAGHCAFIPGCAEVVCGAGCGPAYLQPADANALVLRYAVPFMLRYLKGDAAAGKALRPAAAPDGVIVQTRRR
jgi:predicted dienelactone hydrolase